MKKYVDLIRVKHWIKNFLIFIPAVCARVLNVNSFITLLLGLIAFSFSSSFIYIINDIRDIEKDKQHPRKKNRPLPSGKIKKSTAVIIAIILLLASLCINFFITKSVFSLSLALIVSYIIVNLFYSFGLKNYAIIDIFLLASGFIIRVYYGAAIVGVQVSNWLFLTILSASLFLGLGKRRKELENSKESRTVLKEYNEEFLNKFQYLSLTLMIVFYSLWSLEQTNNYIVFTIPLIIIIFMKYCLIVEKSDEGDPTTILYQDKLLLVLCFLYGIVMLLIFNGGIK